MNPEIDPAAIDAADTGLDGSEIKLLKDVIASEPFFEASRDADARAERFVRAHIEFFDMDRRPLVVYPENANQVLASICPAADFSIIVLGENVYLSLYSGESGKEIRPPNRKCQR